MHERTGFIIDREVSLYSVIHSKIKINSKNKDTKRKKWRENRSHGILFFDASKYDLQKRVRIRDTFRKKKLEALEDH